MFSKLSYEQVLGLCFVFFIVSLLQFGVLLGIYFKKRERKHNEKYEQVARDFKFTLPDRDKSFVRDRLKGSLKPEQEQAKLDATPLKDFDVRLEYTRKTIAKLKASVLTPADRLEVNRISKTVTFYALKNALSPSEARSLNDCFSRLLKLSAKYAV